MSEAGEGGQEQRVLEPMVPEAARDFGVDRRPRFPGRGPQTRIGRQMAWRAEAAYRADLNCNACPKARTNPRQTPQDLRLGRGEKTLFNLLLQCVAASQNRGQLAGQLNDQLSGSLSPGYGHG